MNINKKIYTRVCFVGNFNVGKTSIIYRYIKNSFPPPEPTIGAQFFNTDLIIDNRFISIELWDTCGDERFRSVGGMYYRASNCCVLCFDVNSLQSFQSLDKWKNEFLKHCLLLNPKIILLGNKIDLNNREVSKEMVESWCNINKLENDEESIPYIEVSAKSGINIEQAILSIAKKALINYDFNELNKINTITIKPHNEKNLQPYYSLCGL